MSLRIWIRDRPFRLYKMAVAPFEIGRYFASSTAPKLNIGAGGNRLPGWLNVDYFPPPRVTFMDGARRWPFDDNVFEACLCEHMIEHIPREDGEILLREAFRTLRPDGALRLITPDLEFFARAVLGEVADAKTYLHFVPRFNGASCNDWNDAINRTFYDHGHCYIYSPQKLMAALEEAGFRDVAMMRAGHYQNPVFQGVDGHPALVGHEVNAIEAFALEAKKPV